MLVALLTVKVAAALVPKLTAVAPVKLVPVMVTVVPPAVRARGRADRGDGRRGGDVGELVGGAGGARPAGGGDGDVDGAGVPAGAVAVMVVALLTVKSVAAVEPKLTRGGAGEVGAGDGDLVPPALGPAVGLTRVTVGAAT